MFSIDLKQKILHQIINIMLQHQLSNKWTFWNSYSSQQKQRGPLHAEDYHKNLENMITIQNVDELCYFFTNCKLNDLNNYFSDLENLKISKHPYNGENRKLEAISLFKTPIQPTWQYGQNGKGGQFITTINRDNKNMVNEIYQSLVMQLVFDRFSLSQNIFGVRFVERSNVNKGQFLVKIQIWVSFNDMSQQKIATFTKQLSSLGNQIGWSFTAIQFKNNA